MTSEARFIAGCYREPAAFATRHAPCDVPKSAWRGACPARQRPL
jgi:hypothetical protein